MIAPPSKHAKPTTPYKAKSVGKSHFGVYLTATVCIAIGVFAALYFLTSSKPGEDGETSPEVSSTEKKQPAKTVAKAQDEKQPVKEKWSKETDRVHRDDNKKIIYDPDAPLGSKANPINIDAMTFPDNPIQPKRKLFETHAENYICGLMRTKPGTRIIPTRLPANFDEEFKAHITDPVRIDDEDTEEDIAFKEQMHEFKKEAAKLIGEGMTPTEIILQERKELNKIADHRAVCAAEIGRLKREGASEQEIEDCINAANSIMEKYGARKFMTPAQIKQMLFEKTQNINP